jgi:hypothetical protein
VHARPGVSIVELGKSAALPPLRQPANGRDV